MNVLQTGANVAVTQLKSNNCVEGQLGYFFSLLCCAVQETGHSFKASSFLTLTQSEEKKMSFSYIYARNSSFWCLYVDYKQEAIVSTSLHCIYLHVVVTARHPCTQCACAHTKFDFL